MGILIAPQHQGATNGCGTTALSMALRYWRPALVDASRERLDRRVRPFDLFSAPGDLVRAARELGFQASVLTDCRWEELRGLLEAGYPTLAVVSPPESPGRLHYLLVVDILPSGAEVPAEVTVLDPARGGPVVMSGAVFDAAWGELSLRGLPTGVSRTIVAIAPSDASPLSARLPLRPLQVARAILLVALGIKDIAIAYDRHRPLRAAAGAVEVFSGLVGAFGSLVAGAGARGRLGASGSFRWLAYLVLSAAGWLIQLAGLPLAWAGQLLGEGMVRLDQGLEHFEPGHS